MTIVSNHTALSGCVAPCLAKPHRPTCDKHFILNGRRNEEDGALSFHSSVRRAWTHHRRSLPCRARPPGFLLQVSFLLSPATKINKMGANGVMGSRECRAHSSYHLERMCSAKETRWRLGSEGGDGGLAREAQEPGFPPLEPIPALTLPSPHATWLPFLFVPWILI